jgi:hypothetical protein
VKLVPDPVRHKLHGNDKGKPSHLSCCGFVCQRILNYLQDMVLDSSFQFRGLKKTLLKLAGIGINPSSLL